MKLVIILLTVLSFCVELSAAAKPNVLFLFADDMRPESLGALGDLVIKTPNLDEITRNAFVFRNAFCLGSNMPAVCTPSRNMLLSGKAYFRWRDYTSPLAGKRGAGSLAPDTPPNFPLSMKDAGYVTYHFGKRGNTALEIQAKFDFNNYIKNDQAERTAGEPGREVVDGAIAFLKEKQDDKPFFMYLAFANPHDPRVAAQKYMDLYERDNIPLAKNYLPQHPFDYGEMTGRDERLSPWPRTEDEIRKTWHEYYAVITALDHHIGRLLRQLRDSGRMENTLVIFAADHGIAIGSHGLLGKQNLYRAGMHAPLFFAGPGIAKGESDAMIYLLDIYPTVCDLVGAAAPEGIDGLSFKQVIDGGKKSLRSEMFWSYMENQRAYTDGSYKIIRYPLINRTQLFDFVNDREEMHDLAGDPAQAGRIADLMAGLERMQKHYGDAAPLSVENPQSAEFIPPTD